MLTHHLSDTTKGKLRACVQDLRTRLLADIRAEAERRFRLSIMDSTQAGLRADLYSERQALDAWLEQRRKAGVARERALDDAVGEAATTLLHRLVFIRHMEATGLLPVKLLSEGVHSSAYQEAREWLPELVGRPDDASKGFASLLDLLFAELSDDLPGLFGDVGTTRFFPTPAATLLHVVEALDDADLAAAWSDDTTPGWVYQFWNDPEKERIDRKIGEGDGEGTGKGKVEPHEIAAKTALYTERYMVEWLLQNSLGPLWLAICEKNGWEPEARGALAHLADMRKAGSVDIGTDEEDRWKYYVEVEPSEGFVEAAPSTLRDLRLLDPACGSGHFLVAAFDWLFAAWKEEARHRSASWTDAEIAEAIVEENLHGIDIDPRSVQIAAAAVWLKARLAGGRPRRMHLVASRFELGRVKAEERQEFVRHIADAIGVEKKVVEDLLKGLGDADTRGSLLHVDKLDNEILPRLRQIPLMARAEVAKNPDLFHVADARDRVLDQIVNWLRGLTRSDDLGVRLGAEQLAAGLRFVGMVRDGRYDVVVANPPYLTTRKMAPGMAEVFVGPDLYESFLRRGLELARPHGISAMITLRGWMFLSQSQDFRGCIASDHRLRVVGDLHWGAFSDAKDVSVSMTVVEGSTPPGTSTFVRAVPDLTEVVRDLGQPQRNQQGLALLPYVVSRAFSGFSGIPGKPFVYWWEPAFLARYLESPKLNEVSCVKQGMATADNARFLRRPWELPKGLLSLFDFRSPIKFVQDAPWVPYVKGSAGKVWIEPVDDSLDWRRYGLQIRVFEQARFQNEAYYFQPGVAFTKIGSSFTARIYLYRSVTDVAGSSVYGENARNTAAMMNSQDARFILESFNPTVNFQVGDVERLPVWGVESAGVIFGDLESAFKVHESHRETSVEFIEPGPSPWRHAQEWAQAAVDRPEGAPLPEYVPEYDPPQPEDFISHALGICLGRFPPRESGDQPLPHGILFVAARGPDNLPAAKPLLRAWSQHGDGSDLREHLRLRFIKEHLDRYENRPIHWPLSSARRSFVAWVSIHAFEADSLDRIRAEHVQPCLRALEAELADLRSAATGEKKGTARKGKDPLAEVQALLDELVAFDRLLEQVSLRGPRPPDQECEAPYRMELDDGVRVNSAALFPLLKPQWKEPEKWWGEIASGTGRTAAYWSKTAARYWPRKVAAKCAEEPSHAVAHGRFWELHPERAYAWELRLQDEIAPDFLIDEPGAAAAREKYLREKPKEAAKIREKERKRRERRENRQTALFGGETPDDSPDFQDLE